MNDDPTRLCDDPGTPAFVRDALRSSVAISPVTPDVASALARFDAHVAADGASASASAGAGAGASGTAVGMSRVGWWALGGAGGVLVAAMIWFGIRETRRDDGAHAPRPAPARTIARELSPTTPATVAPETHEVSAPVTPPSGASAAVPVTASVAAVVLPPGSRAASSGPSHGANGPATPARGAAGSANPVDQVAADGDDVRREFAQLARVRAAVAHDFGQALALAAAGNREFPEGMLREERDALAIRALARLGRRAELQRAATAYLRRFPRGIHSAEVRQELTTRPR